MQLTSHSSQASQMYDSPVSVLRVFSAPLTRPITPSVATLLFLLIVSKRAFNEQISAQTSSDQFFQDASNAYNLRFDYRSACAPAATYQIIHSAQPIFSELSSLLQNASQQRGPMCSLSNSQVALQSSAQVSGRQSR